MQTKRSEEFDVLRSLIIISAIVLHFHRRFDLEYAAIIPVFIQGSIFNVGSFFFFTSGYMAFKVYLPKFQKDAKKTTTKILRKGLEIFFIYIGYVIFMRLATNTPIPLDIYDFLYNHSFYTKVLLTFSILFFLSPISIFIYAKSRKLFVSFTLILLIVYIAFLYLPVPKNLLDAKLTGVLFGVGKNKIYYSIFKSLISYCFGFLIASNERLFTAKNQWPSALKVIPFFVLAIHIILSLESSYYIRLTKIPIVTPLVSSIMIFMALLLTKYLLSRNVLYSKLTNPSFILLGKNTLIFYVISNMILGFLTLSEQTNMSIKLVVFGGLAWLAYSVTAWSFYAGVYKRSIVKKSHLTSQG